jgi:hypothetical protein
MSKPFAEEKAAGATAFCKLKKTKKMEEIRLRDIDEVKIPRYLKNIQEKATRIAQPLRSQKK